MTDIKGRTAFITGGGSGIGLGIARAFARAGAKLVLVGRRLPVLAEAKAELRELTEVETYGLDVRDREAYAAVADEAEKALGPVTILVSNAGVATATRVKTFSYELWDWYIDSNLNSVVNGLQVFLPRMMERGLGGHIVNVSSGIGLIGMAGNAMYAATKFAVVGISENLAANPELQKVGIGVTAFCPARVDTDIMEEAYKAMPKPDTERMGKWVEERTSEEAKLLHEQGVGIDAAGEMLLKGLRENAMYVMTDRIIEEGLIMRDKLLQAAVPK
jgi:NAD(P)-dependent dehydrogenase (short-subunit alcohol dehydrogenase family)